MNDAVIDDYEVEKINPWLFIWLKPRKTIRYVMENKPMRTAIILALIFGISSVLDRAYTQNFGDTLSTGAILLTSFLLGPIAGIILWYISSSITYFVGKKLGGIGTFKDVQKMIAWSYVPIIWSMILWIIDFSVLGEYVFKDATPDLSTGAAILFFLSMLIETVIYIWFIVITVIAISEVHKFSVGKAILTMIIPGIVLVAAVILVGIVVMIIS